MTSTTSTTAATIPLTYEQLIARASDHHGQAAAFAKMAGMELRANGTNLDVFQGYEMIMENRPAEEVQTFLWGYVNGEDDATQKATIKALLITAESNDGAANLLRALKIADGYGWKVLIASYGLTISNSEFTKDISGLTDFFLFADGYSAAIDTHCKVHASIDELEVNEKPPAAAGSAIG